MNQSPLTLDPIYDVTLAASRMDVSAETIRAWIVDGLQALPIGGIGKKKSNQYRIRETWLLNYMDRKSAEHAHILAIPIATLKPAKRVPHVASHKPITEYKFVRTRSEL